MGGRNARTTRAHNRQSDGYPGTDGIMADETTVAPTADNAEDEDKRIYKVVTMSAELRDAVEKAAEDAKLSVAALCRQAIAEKIGYDLSSEPTTARRVKHATAEDKLLAHRVASFKASFLRSTALKIQKAKNAHKPDEAAKLEAELVEAMTRTDWTPSEEAMTKIRKSVAETMAEKAAEAPAETETEETES